MIIIVCILTTIIALISLFAYNYEFFTNQNGGYYEDAYKIKKGTDMPLGDCLNTTNYGWCMNNGFDSHCVPGTKDGPLYDKCDKWYHNDVWTRSVLSADWEKYYEEKMFD
jgi:hypothetical protein